MANEVTIRVQKSILSKMEKKLLVWIAIRISKWIKPDHLTGLGLLGAFIAGGGYVLSNFESGFLWLSSLGFIINWFGDSLDGTLARVRKTERPIYGFYLDHNVDAITALVIAIGAGVSPFISFSVAMLILVGYYLLSIFTYINAYLKGTFKISYSGLGPTEFRLVIIILNSLFLFIPIKNPNVIILGLTFKFFDFLALGIALIIIVLYFYFFLKEKNKYEKED